MLLLTIGLIMVLSASSVYSFKVHDGDSYAVVKRQLMWVIIGVPCAWIASRVSHQWVRRLAYPAFSVSLVLLLLTAFIGVERNGNTNWLGVGPFVIQPSEIAKLSLVVWAAHIYANKDRRLANLHQIMVPVVPGMLLATGLVIFGRDLGTALVLFAILIGMLWVVGAPMRFFVLVSSIVSVGVFALATDQPASGSPGSPTSSTRSRTSTTPAGRPHTASTPSPAGASSARASAPASRSGAPCRRPTPTSSSRCSARSSAWSARCSSCGLFLTIAFAALKVARETADPFVRYASFGIVVWLLGQMIINVGMVLALLPVIGIPLPLVSYGGSSLLAVAGRSRPARRFARREPPPRAPWPSAAAPPASPPAGDAKCKVGRSAECGEWEWRARCGRCGDRRRHTSRALCTSGATSRTSAGRRR